MIKNKLHLHDNFIYFFSIAVSVLLSAGIAYREALINPDAICYLLSAQLLSKASISDAMHLCGQAEWPFYSVLIYSVVKVTHVSYAAAAYLLNGVFSLLSVTFFMLIAKELGANQRILWLAAFVILLAHEFNSVREYIIRDHGFWAFYLASILCLLNYFRDPKWLTAFAWSISILIATLFRIEGAIFLFAMPFLAWFCKGYSLRQRASFFFTLNVPTILIGGALFSWLLFHPQQTLNKLGRLVEIKDQLQHGLIMMSEHYQTTKAAIAQYVLNSYSAKEAGLLLIILLCVWYLLSVIANVSWMYAALVVYAWFNKSISFKRNATLVLLGYLAVNVVITFGFLAENSFLTKRYLMALSLVLMIWVPFALDKLLQTATDTRKQFIAGFTMLAILLYSIGGIFDFGYSKSYIRHAGDWLAVNVPANAALYANDNQVMYYSNHFGETIFDKFHSYADINSIAQGKWKKYDYLAVRLGKKEENKTLAIMQEISLQPIQVFSNNRGDKVLIYKVNSQQSVVRR